MICLNFPSFEQQLIQKCSKILVDFNMNSLIWLENWTDAIIFILKFYFVYLNIEVPTCSNKRRASCRRRPDSGTRYDCEGFDLEHDAGHSPQVGQSRLAVRKAEAEISQQVCREEKELHLSHGLPQAEARSSSKRHQGADGASSSFQEALWNR